MKSCASCFLILLVMSLYLHFLSLSVFLLHEMEFYQFLHWSQRQQQKEKSLSKMKSFASCFLILLVMSSYLHFLSLSLFEPLILCSPSTSLTAFLLSILPSTPILLAFLSLSLISLPLFLSFLLAFLSLLLISFPLSLSLLLAFLSLFLISLPLSLSLLLAFLSLFLISLPLSLSVSLSLSLPVRLFSPLPIFWQLTQLLFLEPFPLQISSEGISQ